jgi:hypothetical protein
MVESLLAPQVLRFHALSNDEFIPLTFLERLQYLLNFSRWAAAVNSRPSALRTWDKEAVLGGTRQLLRKLRV